MGTQQVSVIRTRWAAIGAAVAVTLGAGGLSLASAAGDDPATTVLLDAPCRLVDTRPDRGIGGRTTPIGAEEEHVVQGSGPSSVCNVPADAVGLITNVTADQATAATNLRFYPTGAAIPTTSNLNPRPGAAPTPNAVTVGLNGSGQFTVRNAKGSVHVIIDVAGYLAEADTLSYTKAEIDALLAGKADAPSGSATLTVPSAAFSPITDVDNGLAWESAFQSWGTDGFADTCVAAPVTLPAGATITAVKVRYYNEVGAFDDTATTTLARYQKSDQTVTTVATVTNDATGAPTSELATAASISNPVVSDAFTYSAQTCFDATDVYMDYLEVEFTYPN